MKKILLLLLLIPNLVMAEKGPLNNKGLICTQVVKCKNESPQSKFYTSAYEALLESGACKKGYASIKDIEDNSIITPLYVAPIRLWCKANSCSQPYIRGYKIEDSKLPYTDYISSISVDKYTLDRETLIITQYFMDDPLYSLCEITKNKKDVYKPLRDEIKNFESELGLIAK